MTAASVTATATGSSAAPVAEPVTGAAAGTPTADRPTSVTYADDTDDGDRADGPGTAGGRDDTAGDEPEQEVEWADSGAYEIAREVRRRRTRRAVQVVVTLLCAVALVVGVWWLAVGRYVPAPTVTDLTRPEASAAVRAAGLEFATTEEFSETVPTGRVIAGVPGPGEDIARGATLTAVLSKGPERYAVPAVIGKDGTAAREALTAAHLTVGTLNQSWSEDVAEGSVVSASVQPGTSVRPGTTVDLTVSKGREPITVTNWYNRDAKDAVATLAGKGLRVVTGEDWSDQVAAGKVLGQTPSDGTLHRGDTVTLTISKGPQPVAVPDVKGMAVKDAQDTMTKAGFRTTTQPVEVNYLGLGFVARASSDPGTMVTRGSTITLYLV